MRAAQGGVGRGAGQGGHLAAAWWGGHQQAPLLRMQACWPQAARSTARVASPPARPALVPPSCPTIPPPHPPRRWGNNAGRRWKGGRGPTASINFVTAHDGFTLADLVAYNDKHNEANGEDNRWGGAGGWGWSGLGMRVD